MFIFSWKLLKNAQKNRRNVNKLGSGSSKVFETEIKIAQNRRKMVKFLQKFNQSHKN